MGFTLTQPFLYRASRKVKAERVSIMISTQSNGFGTWDHKPLSKAKVVANGLADE